MSAQPEPQKPGVITGDKTGDAPPPVTASTTAADEERKRKAKAAREAKAKETSETVGAVAAFLEKLRDDKKAAPSLVKQAAEFRERLKALEPKAAGERVPRGLSSAELKAQIESHYKAMPKDTAALPEWSAKLGNLSRRLSAAVAKEAEAANNAATS